MALAHEQHTDHDQPVVTGYRQRLELAVRFAIVLAVIYAIPHIWWGFGVDWLAPGDMQSDDGLGANPAITFFAFYGMGALALFSALLTRNLIITFGRFLVSGMVSCPARMGHRDPAGDQGRHWPYRNLAGADWRPGLPFPGLRQQ